MNKTTNSLTILLFILGTFARADSLNNSFIGFLSSSKTLTEKIERKDLRRMVREALQQHGETRTSLLSGISPSATESVLVVEYFEDYGTKYTFECFYYDTSNLTSTLEVKREFGQATAYPLALSDANVIFAYTNILCQGTFAALKDPVRDPPNFIIVNAITKNVIKSNLVTLPSSYLVPYNVENLTKEDAKIAICLQGIFSLLKKAGSLEAVSILIYGSGWRLPADNESLLSFPREKAP
jgi:hypothetical protein